MKALKEKTTADESCKKREILWKGVTCRSWTKFVQQWGVPEVEALRLQRTIAAVMREGGPQLSDLHWKESSGLGRESNVLPEEAV